MPTNRDFTYEATERVVADGEAAFGRLFIDLPARFAKRAALNTPDHFRSVRPSAFPGEAERFAEKESRQIMILEQILIAKVFNFGGICSK